MENKVMTDVIYLDFQKAFDTVPHKVLLDKLWSIGIQGNLWNWFYSYLNSRLQTVSINGHLSSFLPVLSGVPQGSLLGPLLFLIFINDLPSYVHTAKLLLFADDTKCYSSSNLSAQLQEDINRLFQWSLTNISFNSSKSSSIRFNTTSACSPPDFFLNDQLILHSTRQKDLGVIFSNDLSWSSHYENIISKAFKTLGLIRRIVGSQTTVTIRKNLYIVLVRSQLTYCSQIWRPHLLKDIACESLTLRVGNSCYAINELIIIKGEKLRERENNTNS
uniref:Reverse transcriptase domain-containing protein n=1 Tax=Amphimedon queenslandica TaxID=400682 RepID=A0A1X7SEQ1_AMPQE